MTVAALTVSDSAWDQLVLDNATLEPMGPALQDIVVHLEMRDLTSTVEARVAIQYKYDDGTWSTIAPGDVVLAGVTTADYHVSAAPFADRTRLGRLHIRLVLQFHAKAGGAVGARADCSVSVACRPFCC